jgi:phenylalanyl-tRNA synthetase beta chain
MNVSCRWLRDLAPDLDAPPEVLAERLTSLGFPVESMTRLAEGLADIVMARVESVRPHPDADRLRVCEVDGGDGIVQVVCGAPNVVAGGTYPLAPVGATLPGGMKIRRAKLRGEASEGMLCSEIELGLGRGKDGLMELSLDPDAPGARPGTPLVEALGLDDVRLEVEVTSNRPDLLSHRGIAREVAPRGDASLADPEIPGATSVAAGILEAGPAGATGGAGGATVRIEAPDLCPRYLGLAIDGVKVGPSPAWLQSRLRAVGARPINNVVDATNYVLLETGQPLHAFDLERLADRTIVIRRAREGESLRTLDGIERRLAPHMLAICDAERPVAVAGVMGGEDSEVTEATTSILLECALFTPGPVRATRKALGLSTDASYRFERGVDPDALVAALLRCARIVLATAGGTVEGPILDVAAERNAPRDLVLRIPRIQQVLGVPFDRAAVEELLTPLGFGVEGRNGATDPETLVVRVPGWRSWDVTREIDLVEEVARRHGYDHFPDTLGPYRPGSVPDHPLFILEDEIRDLMAARGFLEAQTPAFAPDGEGSVEVLNPISAEERFLRSRLLPGLLRRVEYNLARGNRDLRLHELGTVFGPAPSPGDPPGEATHLAAVLHGRRAPEHWTGEGGEIDLWDVKALLGALGSLLGEGYAVVGLPEPPGTSESPFVPGWAFLLTDAAGAQVGQGGRVDRRRLDLPPWAGSVWGIELSLPASPAPRPSPRMAPLPTHPGVERDLALLVADARPVSEVLDVVRREAGDHFRGVDVFDVYRGKGVPGGMRSVAVRVTFRANGRSLTDAEVEAAVGRITRTLEEALDVRIRGG